MLKLLGNLLGAVMEFLGLARSRQDAKNAPDVKAAQIAREEQAQVDKTLKAIQNHDIEEERREWSEN